MTSTITSVDTGLLSCFVASLDGQLLATANEEGVDVWAVGSGESSLLLHLDLEEAPSALYFDEFCEFLLVIHEKPTNTLVYLVSLEDGQVIRKIETENDKVLAACFLPCSQLPRLIVLWSESCIGLWDLETSRLLKQFQPLVSREHKQGALLKFSPCGRWLIASNGSSVWNILSGETKQYTAPAQNKITCMEFSPTELVLSLGTDKGLLIHCTLDGAVEFQKPIGVESNDEMIGITYSFDGSLVYGAYTSCVRILQDHSKTIDFKTICNKAPLPETCRIRATFSLASSNSLLAYTGVIGGKGLEVWLIDTNECFESPSPSLNTPTSPAMVPQKPKRQPSPTSPSIITPKSDAGLELADTILASSTEACTVLSARLAKLKVMKMMLTKGSVEKAMVRLNQMNDTAVTHDVLNQGLLDADESDLAAILRFEDVKLIVPRLLTLLNSKEPGHVEGTLISLRRLTKAFGSSIKGNSQLSNNFTSLRRQCVQLVSSGTHVSMARDLCKAIQAM